MCVRRGLTHQDLHARAELLSALLDRYSSRDRYRRRPLRRRSTPCRLRPGRARRWVARVAPAFELGIGAGHDAGEVHHLGQAGSRRRRPTGRRVSSGWRGDSDTEAGTQAGGHEEHVQREVHALVRQPVDTVVEDVPAISCGSATTAVVPSGGDEPRELVHEQLRRLEVHMRVDEAGHEDTGRRARGLRPLAVPSAATKPSAIARSPSSHSRVKTENTLAPRSRGRRARLRVQQRGGGCSSGIAGRTY